MIPPKFLVWWFKFQCWYLCLNWCWCRAEADDTKYYAHGGLVFIDRLLQEDDQHDQQDEWVESEGEGLQKPLSQRPWHGRWPKVWYCWTNMVILTNVFNWMMTLGMIFLNHQANVINALDMDKIWYSCFMSYHL